MKKQFLVVLSLLLLQAGLAHAQQSESAKRPLSKGVALFC